MRNHPQSIKVRKVLEQLGYHVFKNNKGVDFSVSLDDTEFPKVDFLYSTHEKPGHQYKIGTADQDLYAALYNVAGTRDVLYGDTKSSDFRYYYEASESLSVGAILTILYEGTMK